MSENKALQLSKGDARVQCGQVQEVVLTFVQDLSPKDAPLPGGSTFRIVLDHKLWRGLDPLFAF